jgi:Carboxypeptidase regulatory-like domain
VVDSTQIASRRRFLGRTIRLWPLGAQGLVGLSLGAILCGLPVLAQAQLPPPGVGAPAGQQLPVPALAGTISGIVVDPSGGAVVGAVVRFTRDGESTSQAVLSGDNGEFSLANVAPGSFHLEIAAPGLATQVVAGTLHPAEIYNAPQVTLALAVETSQVRVVLPRADVAEAEIKEEEKQRVLGVIPNFYVSYLPDPVPLTSKQKFELAWRTTVDPVTFVITGAIAGIQQAQNQFSGYGQGARGYGERYGASYADLVTGTFIGSAILPSLLKQDPRYFYKGTGTVRSRFLYAIANSVICKGDNRHWQANYSNILGNLAAGGISNLYYPASDRNGAELTFASAAIGIGATAGANLVQEFVIRKLTPNIPTHVPTHVSVKP